MGIPGQQQRRYHPPHCRHWSDRGIGVLLVSAELDEIMALSDRIAVMYRGQIVAIVEAAKVTREQLGLWMAGAHPEE